MLTPATIIDETDRLKSLLDILRNPEKYQEQVDELRQLSKDTEEKIGKLVDQTVEYQNIRNEATELVSDHQVAVNGLQSIMEQAGRTVDEAVRYRNQTNSIVAGTVKEAKELVGQILEASNRQKEVLDQKVTEQETRIVQLDREIVQKEDKLADVEGRLKALRESMGGV